MGEGALVLGASEWFQEKDGRFSSIISLFPCTVS